MKSKIERCVHHRFAGGAFHITGGVVLCGHIATYKAVCLSGGGVMALTSVPTATGGGVDSSTTFHNWMKIRRDAHYHYVGDDCLSRHLKMLCSTIPHGTCRIGHVLAR